MSNTVANMIKYFTSFSPGVHSQMAESQQAEDNNTSGNNNLYDSIKQLCLTVRVIGFCSAFVSLSIIVKFNIPYDALLTMETYSIFGICSASGKGKTRLPGLG